MKSASVIRSFFCFFFGFIGSEFFAHQDDGFFFLKAVLFIKGRKYSCTSSYQMHGNDASFLEGCEAFDAISKYPDMGLHDIYDVRMFSGTARMEE